MSPIDYTQLKKDTMRSIDRMIQRLSLTSKNDMPDKVLKKIETTINKEKFMQKIVEQRFKAEAARADGSQKWKSLRPATIKRRVRQGFGARPILQNTGRLKEGAKRAVANSFKFRGINWDVGMVGVEYAEYHQNGAGKIPRRAFLNKPNAAELEPVLKRAREVARKELRKMMGIE